MRNVILLLLIFTVNVNASEKLTNSNIIADRELTKLENNYKKLIVIAVNNKFKNSTKKIDPKYLDILSSCHLAGTTAWPAKLRLKMLTIYNKSSNITSAMNDFEKVLDDLVLTKALSQEKMFRYVNLQSVIYDGCAKNVNSDFWRKKLVRNGMVDYYP